MEGGPVASKFQFELTLDDQDGRGGDRECSMIEIADGCNAVKLPNHPSDQDRVEMATRDVSPAET